LLVYIV